MTTVFQWIPIEHEEPLIAYSQSFCHVPYARTGIEITLSKT
jgi:hypothetical protein